MSRSDICSKWNRLCVSCGTPVHIHKIRRGEDCPECGDDRWTRDRTKVEGSPFDTEYVPGGNDGDG